jgi:glycosyltransferase involved in cell wall biosynthesis
VKIIHWPNNRPAKLKDVIFFKNLCLREKPDVVIGQFGSKIISMVVSKILGVPNRIIYHHTLKEQLLFDLGKINRLKEWIQKFIYSNVSTMVFTNSLTTKMDVCLNYSIAKKKINVFPYLLRDILENDKVLEKSKRTNEVVFVSRVDPSKGHAHIIEQIPDVLKKFPNLKFTFVGKGSEIENLSIRCVELGISGVVNFTGFVAPEMVYKYMKRAIVHISASKSEAFGLVNVEALCCGTPILGPKTGGITDIIKEGENGYFYKPEQPGEMVEKIGVILNDWNAYSQNARKSFEEMYSIQNSATVSKQVKHIESLLR